MTLELVDSLMSLFSFRDKVQKLKKNRMCNNKKELCSEATSNSNNDDQESFLLQGHVAMYPERTENKIVSHTGNDNNQLELDSEITCNTNNYSSLADQLGNPAEEEQDPGSDSLNTW